jgi:hypothetical protein
MNQPADPMHEAFANAQLPDVAVVERAPGAMDVAAWDVFAQSCDSSFLGSWRVVRANRLLSRVRVFEFFAGVADRAQVKIAQCAVALGRERVRFIDRLHLLPEFEPLWDGCLQRVVERCGPATYEYGSGWNREDRRPPSLAAPGLMAGQADGRPFRIDRVDFSRWGSFAAYHRDVSENIRRDYKKAVALGARVETRAGLAAVPHIPLLVRLRRVVMQRNGEPFALLPDLGTHVLKLLCIGDMAFISTAWAQGRCQAAFFGVRFGGDVYYLAGGTEAGGSGCGSFLFLTLIEQGFANGPNWKLYLGQQWGLVDPATYTYGNHLYRRKLRATSVPGTAFRVQVADLRAPCPAGDRVAARRGLTT